MHIAIPIAGAKINLAKVLTTIFGKSFFTAENWNCPPKIISESHGAMEPRASKALKINLKFDVENRHEPQKGRIATQNIPRATP